MANTTNNRISTLVNSQVPFFVRNDHPNFVVFLEKYYEYLEQTGKAVERSKNLTGFSDIDLTEDVFADLLYNKFLNLLPTNIIADKSLVLKYAKDFFRSKGTEKSIRFLLKVLFGTDVGEFYYPKTDILKASDGKWFIEKSVRLSAVYVNNAITTNLQDIERFTSRLITGSISGATAIVETVTSYYESDTIIYELRISNQFRDFVSGDVISATFIENGITNTITANTFGGIISKVNIISGGSAYTIGTLIPIQSNTGTGGRVSISGVTSGNLPAIVILYSGAGYVNTNSLLITGGGGSGANANVSVNPDNTFHPNSYNIITSTISLEANTLLSNSVYTNLSSSNANTSIINAVSSFVYSNTGPINRVIMLSPGTGYSSLPTLDVQANTMVRSLGILGRMDIINGGLNYQVNNTIEFINPPASLGTGAQARVSSVNASGAITGVQFTQLAGHAIGGSGYNNLALPIANVVSNTGSSANIAVTTILGDGAVLLGVTETIGKITQLSILSGGVGYQTPPTLNLSSIGDGTAQVSSEVITGALSYPGRFINDDGMISSFNYLEDRDFYQNYSYVVRTNIPFTSYKKALNDLIHPSGMKVFGEFGLINQDLTTMTEGIVSESQTKRIRFRLGNYFATGNANGSVININIPSHGIVANNNVYVEFITGSTANLANIQIINSGIDYANGFINIANGSGSSANASIFVNATGHIVSTAINNRGQTYSITDNLIANVSNLVTRNVANIIINNGAIGFSNGFIVFSGGTGRNANANVSVNATGAIVNVTIRNRGTGYTANNTVIANVSHLLSHNIATINIAATGTAYSNGFITFTGGSGFGANANVRVNATGAIVNVTIQNRGVGYAANDASSIVAGVAHLKSYIIDKLFLLNSGANYSNGFISFVGGSGTGANANITVNPLTGTITSVRLNSNGTGYGFGNSIYANVESLITSNIANVIINNSGQGYSNGFINFLGGSGVSANAVVTVNSIGSIVSISLNNRGTGYAASNLVYANVEHLLTHNVNSISITNGGSSYSNGFIIFEGGSGRNANANVSVNATGAIVNVTIQNRGTGYLSSESVVAKISQLATYNLANVFIVSTGTGYSNGFITFTGGSGFGANANVSVNGTGAIISARIFSNGSGYSVTDYVTGNVIANVASLGGTGANLTPILQFGNASSGSLSTTLARHANTSNLLVTLQKGSGNANITVSLSSNSNNAILPVTIQRFSANANLSVTLQNGGAGANIKLNLTPEPLNTITNSIFLVSSSNTNWFAIRHPNTANIFGTSYAGVMI